MEFFNIEEHPTRADWKAIWAIPKSLVPASHSTPSGFFLISSLRPTMNMHEPGFSGPTDGGGYDSTQDEALAGPRRKLWWSGLGTLGLVIAIAALWSCRAGGAGADVKGARALPVVVGSARKGDIGVNLSGLGTVTPLNTVTVRSRVDGQILRVAFQEGQTVREGDLLVEIDPRPFQVQLSQAEGQRAKDEAALKNAKADLERFRSLLAQGILPRQQLDTQGATVDQLTAAIMSDQSLVDNAKLNLVYSHIAAPISGKAGLRLVDTGNMVRAADPNGLLTITQVQPITVVFTIPADSIPQVAEQFRSGRQLSVEAYDRDFKAKLATGSLLAVDNQIDPATGTLKLKALFSNANATLFPNQFVNVRLQVDTLKGVVIAPTAAIQRSAQSSFVYAVKPDSTVEMRPVEIQYTEGDSTVIRKGVSPGDVLVVDGVDKLRPGMKVNTGAGETPGSGKAKP